MNNQLILIYLLKDGKILVTKKTHRELILEHRNFELIGKFSDISNARTYVQKNHEIQIKNKLVIDEFSGATTVKKKTKKKQKKRPPSKYKGIPRTEEVRSKISKSRKNKAGSHDHYLHGEKTPKWMLRLKSQGLREWWKKQPMRWCVSPEGVEKRVAEETILPDGWMWGRSHNFVKQFAGPKPPVIS